MKILLSVSLIAIALTVFAYNERQQKNFAVQKIDDYARQNSQLLTQIESNSVRNIESERQLLSLQKELNSSRNQRIALEHQLELSQQRIDPDYEQMESRIREQVNRELQSNEEIGSADTRLDLVKKLSELNPDEMGELFALNGQYGAYLQSLDVSDERMDVVINALSEMISNQNQARSEIIQAMRADPAAANRGDLALQMQAINHTEAQREALSYSLTESELDAFVEFQKQRQDSTTAFTTFGGARNGIRLRSEGQFQNNAGQPRAIQLLPAPPPN